MSENKNDQFQKLSAPKGVPDYVPPQSAAFIHVRDEFARQARIAGYQHIELPVFEDTTLFARGVGESTDVVSKEMYTFEDRGGRSVTLRPEGTAGVMRSFIEHNMDRGYLPVKLNYYGPFFRYERPQAGRYRQLQQVGVEAIGMDDPLLDAEVIALADRSYRAIGLSGFRLELTSLGDRNCRPAYREKLQQFLFDLPLDEETRKRAEINPLRVLDDKREEVREMTADAPLMLDHLCDDCRAHFEAVTAALDSFGVPYVINPRMVRGLDYYTKTTFEFVHDGLGAQSGIGGGGRYDGLMAQIGGPDLSGIGYGLGVDRAVLARGGGRGARGGGPPGGCLRHRHRRRGSCEDEQTYRRAPRRRRVRRHVLRAARAQGLDEGRRPRWREVRARARRARAGSRRGGGEEPRGTLAGVRGALCSGGDSGGHGSLGTSTR